MSRLSGCPQDPRGGVSAASIRRRRRTIRGSSTAVAGMR